MTRYSTATFVGALALVAVMVVGGLVLAWRSLASAPAVTTVTATDAEIAWGATEVELGVPWGFTHDALGAASAAASAVTLLTRDDAAWSTERLREVGSVVFTEAELARQLPLVDDVRRQLAQAGWDDAPDSRRTYHFAPLSVRTTDSEKSRATVEVWGMTVLGVGDNGGAAFTTTIVELEVVDDAWRVVRMDSVEGPVPLTTATADPPGAVRLQLRDAMPVLPLPLPAVTS